MSQVSAPVTPTSRVSPSRVLAVACLGAFLAFLDSTIVEIAFPPIRESFPQASLGGLSWVLNGYNIAFAACLIVFGRLTDLIGRKRAFVLGNVVFAVASGLCGIAPTLELLVAFRVLQGLGAALLVPASLALVVSAFATGRRTQAISVWGASAAAAAGLGPPIGGLLIDAGGWRWAFLVNVPVGILTIMLARRVLDESRAPGRRTMPDLTGAAVLAVGIAVLNLGIVKGQDWGWTSAKVLGSFAAAAALGWLFVASSRRHREPLLDPALLRVRMFAVSSLALLVTGLGFFANGLTNILWLQSVWGYTVLESGLALVPGALIAGVVAIALGPLAERFDYRVFIVPGALLWASAFVWYHQRMGLEPAFWTEWMPGQVLSGIGVGAALPLLGSAGLASVPGGRYATASAIASSARQFGGVLGIAVLVVVLGDPTPETIADDLRRGWVLSIVVLALTGVVAMFLGTRRPPDEELSADLDVPQIFTPDPPQAWDPDPAHPGGRSALTALPPDVRRRLESSMRLVRLRAGRELFHQGDPPGSAFAVRTGRLEVEIDGDVVRELGPGDVVGELSLLTGEPRSATIRARRDSSMLELPRAAFDDLTMTDPLASRAVMGQMADWLRNPAPAPAARPPQRATVVSVVALDDGAPVAAVAHELVAAMSAHHRVASFTAIEPSGLERAEQDLDRVVLVGDDGPGRDWPEFCLRQADTVVLVARADGEVSFSPLSPAPARQPEVVLVGADPGPAARAAWVEATDAWDLTVASGDLTVGLRSLAARLAGRSVGVVLGGGAAGGLSHIGVLRELEEAGIHVDRVAGTSIGAILGAGYARGLDAAALEEAAYSTFVRGRLLGDWRLPTESLIRGGRMRAAAERIYGPDTVIEGLPRQLWVVSTDLVSRSRQVHRRGSVVDSVLASSRLPVLLPPMPTQDGRLLVDGGVLDMLPADLLARRDEGPVIAVEVGDAALQYDQDGRLVIPGIVDTLGLAMSLPGSAVDAARRNGAWVVSTSRMGAGMLEFHMIDALVQSGRTAARALLDRCDGDLGVLGRPVADVRSRIPR